MLSLRQYAVVGWLIFLVAGRVGAAEPASESTEAFERLGKQYDSDVRPLLKQFCLDCHSSDKPEGELDLERFATLADVRTDTKVWLKAAEMLDNGEMPPKGSAQPLSQQRQSLRNWIAEYLDAEALASAGDPGPVVLRRLNNAEYTYTVRDLTAAELSPAREFPSDSAAGEGFTNTGSALVMSPALLTKYLDAGKDIASHAVLLPDGFRFSHSANRNDWINDILAQIRQLYFEQTDSAGGTRVNLQGIVFDTNGGGRLPVAAYLQATLAERDALAAGSKTTGDVAKERGLSPKYLAALWGMLNEKEGSLLLDRVRQRWKLARPEDAEALAAEIAVWQNALTRFQSVGHMKPWMTPAAPLTAQQEIRYKLPADAAGDVVFYLTALEAGDGAVGDAALWQRPRLVAPGRPDLLLRDVRRFTRLMASRRGQLFAATANCLKAAAEASLGDAEIDIAELARRHNTDASSLQSWLDFLGIGPTATQKLDLFQGKIVNASGYDFIRGWGSHDTPLLLANSSDQHVRVPGNMKPHGVTVHPSPTLQAAVGWRSPVSARLRVEGKVSHAHPECGNGIVWSLELRRGAVRQRLANGTAGGNRDAAIGPIESLAVRPGDLVSLLVGPRDGNHACDLTDLELTLKSDKPDGPAWSLTSDVSPDVQAGNPHADRLGNKDVWHFYTEPVSAASAGPDIPAGSLLARWQLADKADEKASLAKELQALLSGPPPADANHPDAALYQQLASLGGPLFAAEWQSLLNKPEDAGNDGQSPASEPATDEETAAPLPGLDPALFGKLPDGRRIDDADLCFAAPASMEIRLPADLAAGAEFVAVGTLVQTSEKQGSIQLQAAGDKPDDLTALRPDLPIVVRDGSAARQRFEKACDDFRSWFPAALCYTKIVPVDEVVTLTLFHREDEELSRLLLDDEQHARLDRLWQELHFISGDALTLVDAFAQLLEYASQDSDPKLFEPFRQPIMDRAAAFRQTLLDAEPLHINTLVAFASRAYRRPLTGKESGDLRALYQSLREQELSHDEAFRFTLARLFVSPAFLYRLEKAPPGEQAGPVSDWELATRLSYFLWSSAPDDELRAAAAAGRLREPEVLAAQSKRMLADGRVRRLATEFACQWLHIYEFDALDEKSERHFPTFLDLRDDMYEEPRRFFTDLFQHDGSILSIFDCDHTFVNEALAGHYDMAGISGPEWRRVAGQKELGRGGILGMSATLAKQSGASRTSPILRGNWVSEVLLGEKLPRPPKDVPPLPDDETATAELTVRQLVEQHTNDERCASCHRRIDPLGFALEGFDAIGRRRDKDLAGRPVDESSQLADGTHIEGLGGLRDYLLTARRDAVLRQFCRKLLGYALGRGVQLSDEPLLTEMRQALEQHDYRFSVAVESIVRSPQFREIRGRDAAMVEAQ
ncbi:MAG: DUF1592 domain-containing protein [Pirellulales bacterium]